MSKIMVVDDDPAGQRLIKYMLTPEGHEVITAANGIMGLQVATQQSPDLVILDVMLPGLDGFEVCRRLRTGAKTAKIPIIMLSGKAQASDRDTGLKMGANEYLVKPVDRHQLISVIGRLLQETQAKTQKKAKVYAFIGARGGAGTSTVTTNVSVALEKTGHSVILVDLNPSYSALAEMLGLNAEKSIAGLFRNTSGIIDVEELKNLFVFHDSGLRLLWGESYPDESDSYTPGNIRTLVSELEGLADFIIIDIPSSPSENAVAAIELSDTLFLVAGANKESLERIGISISRLARYGVGQEKVKLVLVDRTGNSELDITASPVIPAGLPVAGIVHYCENECSEAEAESIPVLLKSPSSRIAEDISSLAGRIAQPE